VSRFVPRTDPPHPSEDIAYPLEAEARLTGIQSVPQKKLSTFHYKDQLVKAVEGNNVCEM
jgi:hypothetical protein